MDMSRNQILAKFDAVEIHPVRIVGPDEGDVETCDTVDANSFGVYWHLKTGGAECIGDAITQPDAQALGQALADAAGVDFHDFT